MNKITLQIAYITGRSSPESGSLSPVQLAFIKKLAQPGRELATLNFPYRAGENEKKGYLAPGLIKASYHNCREYLSSRHPEFQTHYRPALLALLARAPHTVLLSGSCGLELFNNLNLPKAMMSHVSIFAYGPVARQRPLCHHTLVQGQRDLISRFWCRQVHSKGSGGHLNYLSNPALLTLCERFIAAVESTQGLR